MAEHDHVAHAGIDSGGIGALARRIPIALPRKICISVFQKRDSASDAARAAVGSDSRGIWSPSCSIVRESRLEKSANHPFRWPLFSPAIGFSIATSTVRGTSACSLSGTTGSMPVVGFTRAAIGDPIPGTR
jgi:hypothetical protein